MSRNLSHCITPVRHISSHFIASQRLSLCVYPLVQLVVAESALLAQYCKYRVRKISVLTMIGASSHRNHTHVTHRVTQRLRHYFVPSHPIASSLTPCTSPVPLVYAESALRTQESNHQASSHLNHMHVRHKDSHGLSHHSIIPSHPIAGPLTPCTPPRAAGRC